MIRVLVVDDNSLLREWISATLDLQPDMHVVGQCADGAEVLAAVLDTAPHVVLMDLSMPQFGGLAATHRLGTVAPGVRVVVHTAATDHRQVEQALRAGAVSAVPKTADPAAVIDAVRRVAVAPATDTDVDPAAPGRSTTETE